MPDSHFTFTNQVRPICQIGMSTIRNAEPTSWLDVSCHVHEAELFRGRERFNDRFEPGTASVTFSNDTGWADLGGTYTDVAAAELRPGRQIRIGVHGPWTPGTAPFVRWLYRGYIDQATPTYDPTLHDIVTVNCIDALGEAGSVIAPQGDHQGINETVSNRLNRVLNAVGWWGTKRKIAATTTTVQGTSLGAPAIDHLGQAADSAGGVVFGDLDGDVVFKDIDWMLYDPDDPPDGDIGPGDPGEPPGGGPPYIDPTPGPVYDPDDPPAEHPPKVCVCADGSAGTLIEKGDNYRLYVRDGHLFYESGGHTWDLGPYTGGCTCVDPDGPERSDDPDEDGDYDISPFPPVELPPAFAVELLAWSDGGLADPPAAEVTVVGVAPGHDCTLAVLVNALGSAGNTVGLAPIIVGGDLDWTHRRDADQTGDGAASFLAIAPVGRDDLGTFPVNVTWAEGMTSRSHIVTVWKITAAAANYVARFDAGSVLYALTDSNPPTEIEPGDGPHVVTLAADRTPLDVDAPTRTVDITIAQSLAEEGTEPFGAILVESNGPWNYPPNAPAQPEPVLLAGEWVDEFERANGPLGSNWIVGPGPGYLDELHPLAINTGAAVATATRPSGGASPYRANAMRWFEAQGADQAVEIEIDPIGYCYVFTQANGADFAQQFCDFQFGLSGFVTVSMYHFDADGSFGDQESVTVLHGATPVRLRLESDADGTQRAYVDDVLALTWVDPDPVSGPFVGIGIDREPGDPDVRVLRASGASLGAVRKASWVSAWRVGTASNLVMFDDVNTGPSDIQSAQACLVVESAEVEAGWRLLGYDLRATGTGVTAAGTMSFDNPPRPGSFVAVMVGVTAATDLIDTVTITGVEFARSHVQHKVGSSWGQGAIFTGPAPLDFDPSGWAVLVGHPEVESISAVVYEIAAADATAPVGAVASGVLGDNTAGSVDGPSTITLSAAGDAAAVVLAYLHVAADPDPTNGATTVDGDEWHEEFQSSGVQRAYLQTMSRAPGQPESTSTSVHWDDVQTGDGDTYSGVQLAVEVKPSPDFVTVPGPGGVWLGGLTDPWNGTIDTAGAYNPDGTPIWEFP